VTVSYASAGEIWQYLKTTATKFDLESQIKFRHEVQQAVWDEDTGLWNVEVLDKNTGKVFKDQCNFLMNGGGYLKYGAQKIAFADSKLKFAIVTGNGRASLASTPSTPMLSTPRTGTRTLS
jgi:cation diffusion facilitator CzcD-associated flavoprotein CzcO